jgi:hypothetical protein
MPSTIGTSLITAPTAKIVSALAARIALGATFLLRRL